jgi:integrase/recombinase XerD
MTDNDRPISPLRARMLDDMALRKLGEKTQKSYVRSVKTLAHYLGRSPDIANAEDLRRFQLDLVKRGATRTTINAHLSGLRFFFEVTLARPEVMKHMKALPVERRLPVILSVEEVGALLRVHSNDDVLVS